MDRDDFLKQLDRWIVLVREASVDLFDKGLGPDKLMATAITIADAMLYAEITKARSAILKLPGAVIARKAK
jgi:hypothetical protein